MYHRSRFEPAKLSCFTIFFTVHGCNTAFRNRISITEFMYYLDQDADLH